MHHHHHHHHLVSNWRTVAPFVGIASLAFACSGGEVDLGSGSLSRDLRAPTRCAESTVIAEDLQIANQAELDALRGCEEIHGLRIEPFPGIDLTALSSLRVVTDAFQLGATPLALPEGAEAQEAFLAEDAALLAAGWVDSLHGLEALESVGTFYLTGVAIRSFAELESLTSIGNGLLVTNTPHLLDFAGLQNAQLDTIWITNAPELQSLNGLDVTPSPLSFLVMFAPRLTNIDALLEVEYFDTLMLSGTGISTLPSFSGPVGANSLSIDNNAELTNVDSLDGFEGASIIYIAANPRLASIPPFEHLVSLDTLTVIGNDSLQSLDLEFPALQPELWYVAQREVPINPPLIEVAYNATLERIALHQSLPALQILSISNNVALTEVDFGGLTSTSGLFIDQNPALTSALTPSLRSVDYLEITNNPQLSVTAFEAVQSIEQIFAGNLDADLDTGAVAPTEPIEPADAGAPAAP